MKNDDSTSGDEDLEDAVHLHYRVIDMVYCRKPSYSTR